MQSSNKADNGGLNFVFESGSSGRENKKYVRSHAAKVGWSQRSRKQAQAANKDDVVATTKDATPRKRRKTTHQDPQVGHAEQHQQQQQQQQQSSICSPPPTQHSVNIPVHSQAEAGPEASRSPALQASTQLPPQQQHVLSQDGHSTVHSAPQAPTSAIQAPPYNYAPSSSSSPPRYLHRPGQPASVRAQDVTATSSIPIVTGAPPTYPLAQGVPHWHTRPEPVQHDFVAQHSVVPLFRPAASPGPMYPPQVMSGADVLRPVPPTSSPMPSPRLPPIANVHTSGPSLVGANWRQYDNMPVVNPAVSQPSTPAPGTPIRHDEKTEASTSSRRPASPKKRSTPAFLELILNEDYPMWKNVDSGNDSFNVFPVRWQPFYGRLLHNYRSNMLVQLDEILTGWTVDQKLAFNQMPLRLAGSEPCLFYSLLATAAIMMPPGLISPTIPRWLQTRTVECLNQAFSDPKRAYADATILTLNMVALFESCNGHAKTAASTHQPVLRRMVDERGGLVRLVSKDNEDSKNLVRFLAWTDRIIRCQTGNPLMFEDFEEEESVARTNWEGIWARMEKRVEENKPEPIDELPDC